MTWKKICCRRLSHAPTSCRLQHASAGQCAARTSNRHWCSVRPERTRNNQPSRIGSSIRRCISPSHKLSLIESRSCIIAYWSVRPFILYMSLFIVFFCRCLCRYEYNYHVFVWSISSNRWLDAHALPGWARPDVCATYIWVGPGPAVRGVCALNAFTGVYFTYASAHRCGFIISNYSVPFKIIWAWPALRGIIEGACAGRARTDYGFYGESTHKRRVSVPP